LLYIFLQEPFFMETLDDLAISHVASYFQALSEPMRLKVLNALRGGDRNVGELADLLGCTTANISKHLSLLAKGGFVERQTRGNSAYYRIADQAIFDLCNLVCGQVGRRLAAQSETAAKLVSVQGKA
jgi:DNA-binding transcriptional ArsR family regulator